MPKGAPANRLGLAQWLTHPDHPLTARVNVNRFWAQVFGQGLVPTAGEFGITGEPPTHPKLLDWLAVEFRESGWDVKALFRLMVTSATYRQSAVATPEKLEKDADNRLLSRGPRFRMHGEMIRDLALAASGLLSTKVGGPSVKPYQPPGIWEVVAMEESNTKIYVPDRGQANYRRSLYTFWKRAAPPPAMETFNAPTREQCAVDRERTNTPLQALVTLNDVQFVEASRRLAEVAIQESGKDEPGASTPSPCVSWAARSRPPSGRPWSPSSAISVITTQGMERPPRRSSPSAIRPRPRRSPPRSWRRGPWWRASSSIWTRPSTNDHERPFRVLLRRRRPDDEPARAPGPDRPGHRRGRAGLDARKPQALRRGHGRTATLPHFRPKARRAIWLFPAGAPSQIDTWDYKPKLREMFGKELPGSVRGNQRLTTMTSGQKGFPVAPSLFKFAQARAERDVGERALSLDREGGGPARRRQVAPHRGDQP